MVWNFNELSDEELLMFFVALNDLKDEVEDKRLYNSFNEALKKEITKRGLN